jgi:hypothetical protein
MATGQKMIWPRAYVVDSIRELDVSQLATRKRNVKMERHILFPLYMQAAKLLLHRYSYKLVATGEERTLLYLYISVHIERHEFITEVSINNTVLFWNVIRVHS